MITKINIKLNLPASLYSTNISSLLHGVLMELLSSEVQNMLHTMNNYSPLKQRLLLDKKEANWEIVSLSPAIGNQLISLFENRKEIMIEYHQQKVDLLSTEVELIDIKDLMKTYLNMNEVKKYINLKLLTPTSFKSNGQYDIFPEPTKIFRSIMLMFDEFNDEHHLFDRDTLHFIENNIKIIDYRLRSTRFHVEGVKIPSFIGEIRLKVNGPPQLAKFVHFLLAYGTYSGIGIKTSLGMGKYLI